MGNEAASGSGQSRRTLPDHLAKALSEAHDHTGMTYREAAALIVIDSGYWWRLTKGERLPSRQVAGRIIDALGLDDELADELWGVAAIRQNGRVVPQPTDEPPELADR